MSFTLNGLPLDILKLIAKQLYWKDVLNLSKVCRKFRMIHSFSFWKQFIVGECDNPFISLLTWRVKSILNMSHFRHYEYKLVGDESNIIAKYLKYKYPDNFHFYHFDIVTRCDNFISLKLNSLKLKQFDLVYFIVSTRYCFGKCHYRGKDKYCFKHDKSYSITYFMVDNDINNIAVKRVESREENVIPLPSEFYSFLFDYTMSVCSMQILYSTMQFGFGY